MEIRLLRRGRPVAVISTSRLTGPAAACSNSGAARNRARHHRSGTKQMTTNLLSSNAAIVLRTKAPLGGFVAGDLCPS